MKGRKITIGLILGTVAGIIDVIPMILQNLSLDANLSAFTFWIISGFFIATTEIKMNSILKGILVSLLVLIPAAILVGRQDIKSLIPMSIATLVLGGLLGYFITKLGNKQSALKTKK